MFKLVIEDDEGNKTVVPLIRDEISIGRQDGNTIRLTERNVSRRHAKILREEGAVYLEEIAARYGIKKNGERLDGRTEFTPGDVFSIGDYRLTLQSEVSPDAKPSKKKANGAAPASAKGEFANQPTQITKLDGTPTSREKTEVLPARPAKLVIVSSNFAGQQFPLVRKEMVIGRGEECDIIIDHRSVSQQHAKVAQEASGEYKIVDLKSKNGVKVGGEEYRAVHLKRGDIVELGHVKFRFVEPGENYVFTPQAGDDDVAVASGPGKGILIGGLLGVVVLAAIGFLVFGPGTTSQPADASEQEAVAVGATVTPTPEVAAPAATHSESGGDMLVKAEKEYLSGRVWEASGLLEAAKVLPDLSADQVQKIDDLLSKVRREKPLARHYETGRDHFNQERWGEALRAFHRIPNDPPSNIYTLLKEERFQERAVEKVLADAEKLVAEKKIEEAKELAREVIANYDPNYAPALEILDLEDAATTQVAVAAAPKKTTRKARNSSQKPKQKRSQRSAPQDPAVAESAARDSMMKGNWQGVVKHCSPVASKSQSCTRLLGVAYKNLNDTPNACKWFKRVGETDHGLDCP